MTQTPPPLLLIAAGGTGGHMFPAQALAEAMLAKGWRVILSTDTRGARYAGGFPAEVIIQEVSSATFARGGPAAKLAAPFHIGAGIWGALKDMRRRRPDLVIGFGGYPSIPALSAACLLKLPRMIHEQNGVLGRVNRLFARRVMLVACGTWPTALPAGVKAVHTGNPVRAGLTPFLGAPYQAALQGPVHLLVIGGSQGARILSDRVPQAIEALPPALRARLSVSHQARGEDLDRVVAAYKTMGISADVQPFFTDIPRRLAQAQLVISRSGASSVADIAAVGRPAIFIPYALASNDHQTANAKGVTDAGGAVMIAEGDATPQSLSARIESLLSNPDLAAQMAARSHHYARRDATQHLVSLALELTSLS